MSVTHDDRPRWMRGFSIFWRVILFCSMGFGVLVAVSDDPSILHDWHGAVMAVASIGFLIGYDRYERLDCRQSGRWPMPYRQALIYLIIQLSLEIVLLQYSPAFIGPIFAIMGQAFSSLSMRQWLLPILGIVALASVSMGLADAIRTADWWAISSLLFFMAGWVGIAVFIGVLFHDRHERERLIGELRTTKAELERYALQAEDMAALRERARLAREMHDSLGHALVVVNVKLEAAQRLYHVDMARGDQELEDTRALVRTTMAELRRSLTNLRGAQIEHSDLPTLLQRMAEETRSRSHLEVSCSTAPDLFQAGQAAAPAATEALWRIAREALANVERHAAAASAALTIERADDALVLRVTDDGSGIAPSDLGRTGHYGITGMRERVEALGGSLRIAARPGGGTIVEARVPLLQQ